MPQTEFDPEPIVKSTKYGFVVDHPAFWGIPIPGFSGTPEPSKLPDPKGVAELEFFVKAELDSNSRWTNGQIRVLATRMPPLFHALHHNTLVGAPKAFIPRSTRGDLPEAGERALVGLCNLDFASNGKGTVDVRRPRVEMKEFYKSVHGKKTLIDTAKEWGYFGVEKAGEQELNHDFWDVKKVGPLGALWIVLLNEDGTPAWFDEHLGGGYRMWHYRSHNANRNFFSWKFRQSKDKHKITVDLQIGVTPSGHAWKETIKLTLKLAWA